MTIKIVPEEKLQELKKLRRVHSDVSITPPHPHLVDVSLVNSDNSYNIIGYILTNLGMLFIGLYSAYPDKSMPLYGYFFWGVFLLGIGIYVYGKWYLHKKVNQEKISLDEYYGGD